MFNMETNADERAFEILQVELPMEFSSSMDLCYKMFQFLNFHPVGEHWGHLILKLLTLAELYTMFSNDNETEK